MKGIRIIALVGALFSVVSLSAQVTVDAKIDSTRIFIGQQVGIAVEVSADAGKSVEFAHYDSLQQIIPGVEVVKMSEPDTQLLNDGKRMVLTQRYLVTSFDSALYYIPPMTVKVDGKEYVIVRQNDILAIVE